MPVLTCVRCGATKTVADDARYQGMPIADWFSSVGSRCGSCRDQGVQLELTFPLVAELVPAEGSTYQERFEDFHRHNPWVYHALVALARGLQQRGHRRVGIKMLFEVLRWQYAMSTVDPSSEFKLNNNYHSRYARLILAQEPDLADIFELRELKAA